MSNDMFDKTLEVALKHVGKQVEEAMKYKLLFEEMAYYFILSTEGSDVMEEAFALMREHNLVDEEGFWICEDEDND